MLPFSSAVPALGALFVALSMLGATQAPFPLAMGAVMLLAGPHNWMEIRYFLTHMPAHWGPQRAWFTTALGGVAVLATSSWTVQWIGGQLESDDTFWRNAEAAWMTALLLWMALLAHMRGNRWTVPVAVAGSLVVWALPLPWDLLLIYLHPLVALAYLERDLRRYPAWRTLLRAFIGTLPLLAAVVWWGAAGPPPPIDTPMLDRVAGLAGAWLLPDVSPRQLVALYVFLQLLHYGAWIVALPLLRFKEPPWRLRRVPLHRRFPLAVVVVVSLGAALTTAFWCGFLLYPAATWDLYFQLAIVHMLVEFPFLIRKYPT